MDWKTILKVEDIDFDKDIQGFGQYEMTWFGHPKIRLNHQKMYEFMKEQLGREPTEKEIMEAVKRISMHEAAHAGHHRADPKSFQDRATGDYPLERVAYLLQSPESLYRALRNLMSHPESYEPMYYQTGLLQGTISGYKFTARAKVVKDLLFWVDKHAKTMEQKEQLTRMEVAQRKSLKTKFAKENLPRNYAAAVARYGPKKRAFLKTLDWKN